MGKRRRSPSDSDPDVSTKRKRVEESAQESDSDCGSFVLPEELFNDARDLRDSEDEADSRKTGKSKKNLTNDHDRSINSDADSVHNVNKKTHSSLSNGNNVGIPSHSSKNKQAAMPKDSTSGTISDSIATFGDSNFTVYLVRKPVEVSLEDLQVLTLPSDSTKRKKLKLRNEEGKFIVRSGEPCPQMLHVPSVTMLTVKDARKIKPAGIISAQVTITRSLDELPGGPVYEEGQEPEENTTIQLPIKPIKKNPTLKMDHLQQRLKAYGVMPRKKHRRSLKCLRYGTN